MIYGWLSFLLSSLASPLELDFNITTGTFLNADTATEFRVFYELPKRQLTFINRSGDTAFQKRTAQFGILFKLSQGDKELGDNWVISVPQDSSGLHKDKITGELRLKVDPGQYDFYIKIWDLNSQKAGEQKSKVVVTSIRAKNPTSPQFISSRRFVDNKSLTFEIYDFSGKPFNLVYTINSFCDSVPIASPKFINPMKLDFPVDSLKRSLYIITLSVGTIKITDTLKIVIPVKLTNYEEKVKELYYIAKSQEIKSFLAAPVALRDSLWQAFWARKEAEIGIEGIEDEYFSRVDYANEHFAAVRKRLAD